MKNPIAKNLNKFNTPKVEEHSKQHLLEKQLDFEMEDVYGDTRYCEEYYDEWGDYSLGDIGCSGISIRED